MAAVEDAVVDTIRSRITRGEWRPGERLPNRDEMARELGCCLATLQRGVSRLVEEGFLSVGARRLGTVVAETPPHLSRHLFFFPVPLSECGLFWRTLHHVAELHAAERGISFEFFHGIRESRDISRREALVEDATARRIAGILFASTAREFRDTPVYESPDIPRVAVGLPWEFPGIPKVLVDYGSFYDRAVRRLLEQGRRRIAVLTAGGFAEGFGEAMARHGATIRPYWVQHAHAAAPDAAERILHLMFHGDPDDRPDGLILSDDNWLDHAAAGLTAAGVSVPGDVDVVALGNFPLVEKQRLPFTRLGFDLRHMLDRMLDIVARQRRGRDVAEMELIEAVFASECDNGKESE